MGAVADGDKELTDEKLSLSRASRVEALLTARFAPDALTITDESSKHAGHAGARLEGETHFSVRLVSPSFAGLSRVARQRLVHDVLQEEFAAGLHALALELKSPEEVA